MQPNKHIYFSGIGGSGLFPLALMAHQCGYRISGSDVEINENTKQLAALGIDIAYHQDGVFMQGVHEHTPIDWLVVSSAIPPDSPEISYASKQGIRVSKRDGLIGEIIAKNNLKMVAVAGTHGKTSTTSMMIWTLDQLGASPSYIVGGLPAFGPAGAYETSSDLFVYEADEFDRNFLNFKPYLSIITTMDYDHPDTYLNEDEYYQAFAEFISNSAAVFTWEDIYKNISELVGSADKQEDIHTIKDDQSETKQLLDSIDLLGAHNRRNGLLVLEAVKSLLPDVSEEDIIKAINSFPGVARRLEKIAENIYSDYAHHPTEIAATLQALGEKFDKISVVYQPHQNIRQHQVRGMYKEAFIGTSQLYWLPTYLSREDPNLPVIEAQELLSEVDDNTLKSYKAVVDMDDELVASLKKDLDDGYVVVFMGAGSIDAWAKHQFALA
ncbi:MAG: Mur ligase domain-containing protein [Candidatus Saccharimonadales bacterium]